MQYSRSQTDATIDNVISVAILTTSFKKIIIICDASWSIWKWLNSLRFNYVVRSSGTKALPEPTLAVCYLDSHGYISMAFYSESKHFHSGTSLSICRLQESTHFDQVFKCLCHRYVANIPAAKIWHPYGAEIDSDRKFVWSQRRHCGQIMR